MIETRGAWALPAALALLAVVFAIQLDLSAPPPPRGLDAAQEVFSAHRARNELALLLGHATPHPVGSAANREVKQRLVARLVELGLQPAEQRTIGCSATAPTCARVENVLAEIPGTSTDTIVVMAHYDSVEYSPGAGDDGAAVAALLEITRILRVGAPYRNTLLLVFTDAEEQGLLGAEAFFAEHPAAQRVKAVINLEGSGSAGPVHLLRTGPASGELLRAFRRVATNPVAQSFTEEVFKRMPNDTDFSVALRAGLPGIDFAFAGERNHYHTPLDSIANLDLGTLQHHGENTLPLLRALVDADLSLGGANEVYASLGGQHWLHWSPATGILLAVVALVLLVLASWRVQVAPLRLLAATAVGIVTVFLGAVLTLAALWLVDRLVGVRPAWPANPLPWRIVFYAVPLLVLALFGPWASRRIGVWPVLLGAWWTWMLAGLAMAVAMPLAAYLLVPAALLACTAMAAASFASPRGSPVHARVAALVSLAGAAWFLLPLAYLMEITQGLQLATAVIAPLGLLALAVLPAAPCDRGRAVLWVSLAAIGLALALAARVEPYSAQRPQHLNFHHVQEAGAPDAALIARSPEALPERIAAAAPFRKARIRPWLEEDELHTRIAAVPQQAPELTVLAAGEAPWRGFHLTPVADSRRTALCLPASRIAGRARIAGRSVRTAADGDDSTHRCLWFVVPPAEGFDVELELLGEEPQEAYLLAVRASLPDAAWRLAALRGPLAVPVHAGDSSVVYRRLRI